MMLNNDELRAKVEKHCGHKIKKGKEMCDGCKKKISIAKNIERQKDLAWKQHDFWIRQNRGR